MDIVVKSRHLELSERFRDHVKEKLDRVEKFDHKVIRTDVEVSKESNPRLADRAYRVEITCRSRGPVIRAEASADDKYGALDLAWGKLEARMRKVADRRRDHHKRPSGPGMPPSTANGSEPLPTATVVDDSEAVVLAANGRLQVDGDGPLVVREKTHDAAPMTLAQALYEMELVGHDFFLFVDAESQQPSVVYRRRGYDYGVIHLDVDAGAA